MMPIEARWEILELGGFQRIDENHPLDFYLGLDVSGDRVLLLIIQDEETVPIQSQAINVVCRKRHDGQWALTFRLLRSDMGRLFSHLCEDLVESSRKLSGTTNPARFVLARFERWQRLLKYGHTGLLDEAALRGLICELLFLRQVSTTRYGLGPAVNGWVGPLNAAQDFHYPDVHFEVKSIRTSSSRVIISSAEQLDDGSKPLELAVIILDPADRKSTNAFSISDIVNDIRNILKEDSVALITFEERLLAAGYIDTDEYRNLFFKSGKFRFFTVCDGFPRIIRPSLLSGIIKVTYELDLTFCESFEKNKPTGDADGH